MVLPRQLPERRLHLVRRRVPADAQRRVVVLELHRSTRVPGAARPPRSGAAARAAGVAARRAGAGPRRRRRAAAVAPRRPPTNARPIPATFRPDLGPVVERYPGLESEMACAAPPDKGSGDEDDRLPSRCPFGRGRSSGAGRLTESLREMRWKRWSRLPVVVTMVAVACGALIGIVLLTPVRCSSIRHSLGSTASMASWARSGASIWISRSFVSRRRTCASPRGTRAPHRF